MEIKGLDEVDQWRIMIGVIPGEPPGETDQH